MNKVGSILVNDNSEGTALPIRARSTCSSGKESLKAE